MVENEFGPGLDIESLIARDGLDSDVDGGSSGGEGKSDGGLTRMHSSNQFYLTTCVACLLLAAVGQSSLAGRKTRPSSIAGC